MSPSSRRSELPSSNLHQNTGLVFDQPAYRAQTTDFRRTWLNSNSSNPPRTRPEPTGCAIFHELTEEQRQRSLFSFFSWFRPVSTLNQLTNQLNPAAPRSKLHERSIMLSGWWRSVRIRPALMP